MKEFTNVAKVQGKVYDFDLKLKTSATSGKEFISGTVYVAVNKELTNIVAMRIRYCGKLNKAGDAITSSYTYLSGLMTSKRTILTVGYDTAASICFNRARFSGNDYYKKQPNDDGDYDLIEMSAIEGGFINEAKDASSVNLFDVDTILSECEAVAEKDGIPTHVILKGIAFENGKIIKVSFTAYGTAANFFTNQNINSSNMLCIYVQGHVLVRTIMEAQPAQDNSAFGGEYQVITEPRRYTEYMIDWAQRPYSIGDPSVITMEEIERGMQERMLALAELKKGHLERIARDEASVSNAGMNVPNSAFPTSTPMTNGMPAIPSMTTSIPQTPIMPTQPATQVASQSIEQSAPTELPFSI